MHEYGLCESILDAVERRADGRRVQRVRVRVGTLHRVVPPAMDQAFALAAEGTVADGANVELVTVAVRVRCLACDHAADSEDALSLCPACGSADVELLGGDDLILESIQLAST